MNCYINREKPHNSRKKGGNMDFFRYICRLMHPLSYRKGMQDLGITKINSI